MKDENNILISIGIPFYNSESFLQYAINSVLNQTYNNWELILLDDGSTDKSLEIANYYSSKDNRIIVISDGENKGLPTRLNQLSNLANGNYYARMDADDIMHPDRIKYQVEFLDLHPDVDLVGSGLISIDNNNHIIGLRNDFFKSKYELDDVINNLWAAHPTIAGRSMWFKNNPYDPNLKRGQDYDLWIRTIQHSTFSKIKTPLLFYREASTPSLKKYWVSTVNTIKCYWKNREILTSGNVIRFTITKLAKLIVYLVLTSFNVTDKFIERRSVKLEDEERIKLQNILDRITIV